MPKIEKLKNFNAALKALTGRSWKRVIQKEIGKGIRLVAELIRRNVVTKIRRGEHKPLHPYTLVIRAFRGHGGTRPLNETGTMSRNVAIMVEGIEAFVGVFRGTRTRSSGGQEKASTLPAANVAEIQEYGKIIRVTPRMRKFFEHRGLRLRLSTTHIRIPPRPFMRPAAEESVGEVRAIMERAVANVLDTIRSAARKGA